MKTHTIRLALACLCALPAPARAASPRDFVVDLKAAVSDTAPHIVLSWTQRVQSNITAQKIHRRPKGGTAWTKLADLTTTQTNYTDSTASAGVEYEYWMERTLTGLVPSTAVGYLSAGVKVPETDARGTLLLAIDDTMTGPLAPEIAQLKLDLAGDGWTVQTLSVPRSGTAASTKALIAAAYNADPANVKALYLLGHVPVPYSGNQAPDGHGDHVGAWPADGYYADVNGTWTDSTVDNSSASSNRNDNIPGDGKFDQVSLPGLCELEVGRVDFRNMTKAPNSSIGETALLRRYLRKAHDFRHKQGAYAAIPRRTLIRDGFGHAFTAEPFAVIGWAGAFSSVGTAIEEAPGNQWFSTSYAGGKDYLWGHGCGGGSYESASSFGTTTDLGRKPSRVVFTSLFGSYHGDWDADNNLMRAAIAGNATGNSLGLSCFWSGRPNWFPHQLGMGATLGAMAKTSMNAGIAGGGGYTPGGSSFRGVHIGLMGDPALRIHAVEPPRNLTATSFSGSVNLAWTASTESAVQGYHVYRAVSPDGPFARLTAAPVTTTSFTDTPAEGTAFTYLVRTLKLESTPGGSYYNFSTGSSAAIILNPGPDAAPAAPTGLAVFFRSEGAQVDWHDNSANETDFRIERKTNAGGSYAVIATLPANTTTYVDEGSFTNGSVYYYRVTALGTPADSLPSPEAFLDAIAGFVEFTATRMKVNKSAGTATMTLTRTGGNNGAVSVTCTTSNVSAFAGTHYTSTASVLTWGHAETGSRTFTVPVTNTASPQLPRQFKVTLGGATGGLSIGLSGTIAVQIEDNTAGLAPPWTSGVIGTLTDSSPAVSAEGVIGDATIGGDGAEAGDTTDAGRFIYQSRTGDGVFVMQVPAPVVNQAGARFALMVRASTANNAIMAATMAGSPAANFGSKFTYRGTAGGAVVASPAADNNLDTPRWLRLTRFGNDFTSETSADGVTWTPLGNVTLASMPSTAVWGIFHYSSNVNTTSLIGDFHLATYQNVGLTALPPPPAPAGFAVGTVTSTSVPLTWTARPFTSGYRIERRAENGDTIIIASTAGGTTSHTDTTAAPDTAYEYRIAAFNSGGEGSFSPPVRIVTPPASTAPPRPGFLTASSGTGPAIVLNWFENAAAETGFELERRAENGAWLPRVALPPGATTFTDAETLPGVIYHFRLRTVASSGVSSWTGASFTAAGSATGFRQWLLANGLPMDESGAGGAAAVSADNETLPNLVKYALGLPASPAGHGGRLAWALLPHDGNDYLTFTYSMPDPPPPDVSYTVERCSRLTPDGWSPSGIVTTSNTVNAGLRTIIVRLDTPSSAGGKHFVRLKIGRP